MPYGPQMELRSKRADLHILKLPGDAFRITYASQDGSMSFDVCVSDHSVSDAQRKSQALGKLRSIMDELHDIMKDDNAPKHRKSLR